MQKRRSAIYQTRWHLLATLGVILAPFLFLILFSELYRLPSAALLAKIATSTARLAAAYGIAVILGWVLAVSFYRGRRALIALPIFDVLQSFPTFAALPLAALAWGPSNFTVIFFLVITVIWPLFFSILSSLKLIRRDWEEAVAMARLSGRPYLLNFLIPVTVPGLITGSIIGLGEGWEALVATEIIIGARHGLGEFFQSFAANAGITAFGILGFLLIIFSINKLVWLPLLEWSHRRMEE